MMARANVPLRWRAPLAAFAAIALVTAAQPAPAQTPEQWVEYGARAHGGFGSLIGVGVRIGLDALERLQAKPREVSVIYYSGAGAPCACIVDGVMVATRASPGQGTLSVAAEPAPAGAFGVVVVTHRSTGARLRYTIDNAWAPKFIEWNRDPVATNRLKAAMDATDLFKVETLPKAP